jgi:hypothetical protein
MDEFQNFVSLDIAEMLDQVRKFGLFQILAHQRFGQLNENITDAVLTNCKIKAVFGGLPTASARLMAEELFIGELDPKKIKAAIYQTKFWPTYSRDKVYTHTDTRGESFASATSRVSGQGAAIGSAEMFSAGDWFGTTQLSTSSSTSSSDVAGSSEARVEHSSESDGVSDIPIFVPVPFQELSSVQYYSLDEQTVELTAALKEQYERHCFIKIRNQKTQPMLVPFVESFFTSKENKDWYLQTQNSRAGALPPSEIDELIEFQESALVKAASENIPSESGPEPTPEATTPVTTRKKSARSSLFSSLRLQDKK